MSATPQPGWSSYIGSGIEAVRASVQAKLGVRWTRVSWVTERVTEAIGLAREGFPEYIQSLDDQVTRVAGTLFSSVLPYMEKVPYGGTLWRMTRAATESVYGVGVNTMLTTISFGRYILNMTNELSKDEQWSAQDAVGFATTGIAAISSAGKLCAISVVDKFSWLTGPTTAIGEIAYYVLGTYNQWNAFLTSVPPPHVATTSAGMDDSGIETARTNPEHLRYQVGGMLAKTVVITASAAALCFTVVTAMPCAVGFGALAFAGKCADDYCDSRISKIGA